MIGAMILLSAFGFLLGFVGYMPLGNINMTVVQLSLTDSARRLWGYVVWASLMEFVYCIGSLTAMELLLKKPHWLLILKWTAVCVFFALGVLSFFHNDKREKSLVTSNLGRGIFATLVNPLQVPFWLVSGVYLTQNKWFTADWLPLIMIASGAALGTGAILWIYGVGGKKLILKFKIEGKIIDRFVGLLLIGLSFWQLFKLLYP